jgi:uncharacterized membrane protein
MGRRAVSFASLFFVALASGGAFVVYLAYNPAGMTPTFYVETMQHGIHVMLPLAVVLNLGLVFTLASTILVRRDRVRFYLLGAASICIITALLLTVLGNWPINNQIITWRAGSPPPNWTELRDEWWRYHVARAVLLVAALGTLIIAALLRRETSSGVGSSGAGGA